MAKYRVKWKKGQPFIEHGEVVLSGKKKQIKRIKWPSEVKTKEHSSGYDTIKKAIEKDMLDSARMFGGGMFYENEIEPWKMVKCINKTVRLARKLKKHNLL